MKTVKKRYQCFLRTMRERPTVLIIARIPTGDAAVVGVSLGHGVGVAIVDFRVVFTVVGAVVGMGVGAVVAVVDNITSFANTVVLFPEVTFTDSW